MQNLEKKSGLASRLLQQYDPDVILAQEINFNSENCSLFPANNVSSRGYGTAIGLRGGTTCTDVRLVNSPYTETGGFIRKKTTVATMSICRRNRDRTKIDEKQVDDYIFVDEVDRVQCVSFHGYNGQPFKNVSKLVAHVDAVLAVLSPQYENCSSPSPVLFAGDFNSWTREHMDAITSRLVDAGFHLACSWPYPGRDQALDHAFVKDMHLENSSFYRNESDHTGAVLEFSISSKEQYAQLNSIAQEQGVTQHGKDRNELEGNPSPDLGC